jgi:hypothetical protein
MMFVEMTCHIDARSRKSRGVSHQIDDKQSIAVSKKGYETRE